MNIIPGTPEELESLGLSPRSFGLEEGRTRRLREDFQNRFGIFNYPHAYEMPDCPLAVEIADENSGLQISPKDKELLIACCGWQLPPPFIGKTGRTSWIPVPEGNVSEDPSRTPIRAYKIKGVGSVTNGKAHTPRDELYYMGSHALGGLGKLGVLIHKGINDDGSFSPVIDPPRPIGGMLFERARAEFENAKILWKANCPAVRPIAYGKYPDLQWEGKPMGFVILGSAVSDHARIGDLFESSWTKDSGGAIRFLDINQALKNFVEQCTETLGPSGSGEALVRSVCRLTRACGKTLRGFHEAGLVRFAGHLGNFAYDPTARVAIQHDLDSSVPLDSIGRGARSLSILRDLESALIGILHSILHSDISHVVGEKFMRRHNPFGAFLEAYFGKNHSETESAAQKILHRFFDVYSKYPREDSLEPLRYFGEISKPLSEDITEWLMPPYAACGLAQEHPLPYGPGAEYRTRMAAYWRESERVYKEEAKKRIQSLPSEVRLALERQGFNAALNAARP